MVSDESKNLELDLPSLTRPLTSKEGKSNGLLQETL